ncbi:baeRF3 domain-containing protein [Rhodopirellula bahusiensis]|uniref:Uncharacterized protein n=1 Tax=Rhodopirellula bahusiensis TaxID=2014065 RepID=A0A2G1WDE8_9BACT|nr:hypothetical protein [Rhodopirellula bahusiensis]PHQ37048.1 hypothetical protein CEE69_01390 [Rhodopirellula bahusiensis]
MIAFPTKTQLTELLEHEQGDCVSILMGTYQAGRDTNQNPIRFKNLVQQAIQQAKQADSELVPRMVELAKLEHDSTFWQHQSAGLAIYLSGEYEEHVLLSHDPGESVSFGPEFNVRSIASVACGETNLLTLALSWERARLFRSDGHTTMEIQDEIFPLTMDELVTERDPEKQLQYSSHESFGNGGSETVMYHGHGNGEGKIEADRRNYLSRVGEYVAKRLYNTDQQLVAIATEEVAGHFDAAAESVELTQCIQVSPDGLTDSQLTARISAFAKEHNQHHDDLLSDRLGAAIAGELGSVDLKSVVLRAAEGRVDTLLLGQDQPLLGRCDLNTGQVELDPNADTDLVNKAVRLTLKAGGTVRRLQDNASTQPVAAIYRY